MLRCALTGEVPKIPVVTPQGIVYDKDSIEHQIQISPVCPVTDKSLTLADLIPLKIDMPVNKTQTVRNYSFGDYLLSLQNQWNSKQKELYETRKKLAQCERELAQALYETEAAKRVIARILSNEGERIYIKPTTNISAEENTFSSFIKKVSLQSISNLAFEQNFKEQYFPPALNILQGFSSYNLSHLTSILGGSAQFTALDQTIDNKLLIGTSESSIAIFDVHLKSVVQQIQVGSAPIVSIHNSRDYHYLVSDSDGVIYIYENYQNDKPYKIIKTEKKIVNCYFHPQIQHVIAVFDNGFEVIQINNSEVLVHTEIQHEITLSSLHPGGRYLATANSTDKSIRIWDLSGNNLLISEIETESEIFNLNFSFNMLHLTASTSNGLLFVIPSGKPEDLYSDYKTICFEIPSKSHFWHQNGLLIVSFGDTEGFIFMITDPLDVQLSQAVKFGLRAQPRAAVFGNGSYFVAAIGPEDEIQLFN
ncbi:hypothetical protein TVAG_325830 [Trichomonas vaginalis G3]|uniref:Pre-mRNA-processing factor 19 n=1 Tax=Trichomonas vaginalis (strain ATCC PRA-98 / G3) TaxID=412133 RepID=A2EWI4_TRIV3|nr:pre-mRNA-processing factor 19 family [Trichomonas vaginalis G3]EAY03011.1 hypothetical protein TVAG_325830 [Trichomonas vaginalis G3]KAI5501778.1 pre-mRNA-processing factor 19 family [Trichomonas vaginalis G3]|eukprot:XP_001315234.1 hypothetical protein [Trichomonas vaginalis G3]